MPDEVNRLIKLFADDSKLIATFRGVNDLLFKVDKCKAIKFNIIIGIKKFSNTGLFMGK